MKKIYTLLAAVLLFGAVNVNAQFTVNVLHNFPNEYPYGDVTVVGNTLYGMADDGGAHGYGCVFSLNRDGSNYKVLYSFSDTGSVAGKCSGEYPYGSLTYVNGKFYGCTYEGGFNGEGTIFRINKDGSGYKDLWDFTGATGDYPYYGSLTAYGSRLFGAAYEGGANNYGAVFSIDTNGSGYRDIWDFDDTVSNGAYPESVTLAISKGKIYGMTDEGGINGKGLIYSIDTNGHAYKDLLDLNNTDTMGEYPYGSVMLHGNTLYALTEEGNSYWNDGMAFSVDTTGHNYKMLHFFSYYDGEEPYGNLTWAKGRLYGTTSYGGGNADEGTVFSMDSTGGNFVEMVDFNEGNGENPYGDITISGDTLFGTTEDGGQDGRGVVFSIVDTRMVQSTNDLPASVSSINVYPNPNNGEFTVSIDANEPLMMQVYNVLGENVYTGSLKNSKGDNHVDLSNLTGGVYMYKVITETGSLVSDGKVVLEK